MKKDYHKGVRLQVYIPEELNYDIDCLIKKVNEDRNLTNCNDKYTKTDLVKESIYHYMRTIEQYYV